MIVRRCIESYKWRLSEEILKHRLNRQCIHRRRCIDLDIIQRACFGCCRRSFRTSWTDRLPKNGRLLKVFTPDGQKPSGIIGLPIGMYFLTVNRQELADRTPSSRKTSLSWRLADRNFFQTGVPDRQREGLSGWIPDGCPSGTCGFGRQEINYEQ